MAAEVHTMRGLLQSVYEKVFAREKPGGKNLPYESLH